MFPLRYATLMLLGLAASAAAQSPALPVDAHTLALYTFDGADPDTTFDLSGHGLHVLNDGTASVPGRHGNARQFDGVDDRMGMDPVRMALQGATAWTLEYIAKSEDGSQVPVLKSHACGNGWILSPGSSAVGFGIKTTAVAGNCPWAVNDYQSAQAALDTLWHYYALSWDGDSLRIYRDGSALAGQRAGGVFQENQSSSFHAWIGHDDYASVFYTGLADELRVSDTARSADEICTTAAGLGWACSPLANEPEANLPTAFALHAAYPNPFNPRATLRYDVPEAGRVRLALYDALGREVARLVDGEQAAGRHEVVLDGAGLASGLYFVRLTAEGFAQTRTTTLLR